MMERRVSVNVRRAAEFLDVSRSYIYQLIEAGKLKGLRLGERKGLRIYHDSMLEYLVSREIK